MDTLYRQSVTTPYSQTIEIDGIRHAIPVGKDILAQDAVYADLMDRARAALAQPEPQGPPRNCWLDDEPALYPSPCVFDDPSEVISNCSYALQVKCKTDCKYYRTAAQPEPQGPTDEELQRRFLAWWHNEGSGFLPLPGQDHEEHAKRISEIAWSNGAYVARWGTPANTTNQED
jgi:hypothetical protein